MSLSDYIEQYFDETKEILDKLDRSAITKAVEVLDKVRQAEGRLFILGIGGSAANASHAVNDFRKICGIETYSPVDNFAEFSAWSNDSGWDTPFIEWLKESHLRRNDAVMVLSVGGGSENTSPNLVTAMDYAKETGAFVVSIVSRDGGHAAKVSDASILVPVIDKDRITPHAEGFQGLIGHLLVNALAHGLTS